MAQPPPYDRKANFRDLQAAVPDKPLPGDQHDNEYNAIKQTLDAVLARLALIQRDDGELANGSVGNDQLDAQVVLGFPPPKPWVADTDYSVDDQVYVGDSKQYRCLVDHHSSFIFADDLAAGYWLIIVDYGTVLALAETAKDEAVIAKDGAEQAEAGAVAAKGEAETAKAGADAAKAGAENAQAAAANEVINARAEVNKARDWAEKDEDAAVEPGHFSAKHWSAKAEDHANNVDTTGFLVGTTKPKITVVSQTSTIQLQQASKFIFVECLAAGGGGGAANDASAGGQSNGTDGGDASANVVLQGHGGVYVIAKGGKGTISRNQGHTNTPKPPTDFGTGDFVQNHGGAMGGSGGYYKLQTAQPGTDGGYSRSVFMKAKGDTGSVTCIVGAGGAPGAGAGWGQGLPGQPARIIVTEWF